MRSKREPGVQIKTQAQLAKMAEAGRAVASALHAAADAVAPGVTTADLDAIARAQIAAAGAAPSFLGYHGYPATICACVNDEIVHGIPSSSRVLGEGDVVSIDCGGELFQRDDDREETIRHRLEVYQEQTAPLVSFYADEGTLLGLDATGPVDEITERALSALRRFMR